MNKLNNLIKGIDKYTELVKPLLDKYGIVNRQENLKLFIDIVFLDRYYYNSVAIRNLLPLYKADRNFKLPIGLLLRTCLSDFLTYFYFVMIVKENYPDERNINLEINKFLSGNIHYLNKEIELNLSNGTFNKRQKEAALQNVKNMYPEFFDAITGKPIENKNISISSIKKKLEKSSEDTNWAAHAYKVYDVFSKYEHIGALTYDLQKFHIKQLDFDTNGIIFAICHVYCGVEYIVKTMPEYSELKSSFDEINADILHI